MRRRTGLPSIKTNNSAAPSPLAVDGETVNADAFWLYERIIEILNMYLVGVVNDNYTQDDAPGYMKIGKKGGHITLAYGTLIGARFTLLDMFVRKRGEKWNVKGAYGRFAEESLRTCNFIRENYKLAVRPKPKTFLNYFLELTAPLEEYLAVFARVKGQYYAPKFAMPGFVFCVSFFAGVRPGTLVESKHYRTKKNKKVKQLAIEGGDGDEDDKTTTKRPKIAPGTIPGRCNESKESVLCAKICHARPDLKMAYIEKSPALYPDILEEFDVEKAGEIRERYQGFRRSDG